MYKYNRGKKKVPIPWERRWVKALNKILSSEKFVNKITEDYVKQAPDVKDKRSKNITSADKKKTVEYFKESVKSILESNPQLKVTKAVEDVLRSRAFISGKDLATENWSKTLKNFNIHVRKDSIEYDEKENLYKITKGKYAGYYTVMVHNPGGDPSYQVILVPGSQLVNFI